MRDVAEVNTTQPRDWKPTEEQVRRAERNDVYPPAGKPATAPR
jgi:hypothetical protein